MNKPFEGSTLLVGEGDFSFSVSLVNFVSKDFRKHVISTSLETEDSIKKHKTAPNNIKILKEQGVTVYLETDATQIHNDFHLKDILFDRIIFNFPHSGGKSNHKKNRKLLSDFFCSAEQKLKENGQILISLCKGQGGTPADHPMRAWHDSWQVVSMAANASLILEEVWPFFASDFPEYSCTGFRSQDKGFNTEGAITHVFKKAEAVFVPGGDNPLSDYFNDFLLTRMESKPFEEENNPSNQICTHLTENLAEFFEVHQLKTLDPIQSDKTIQEINDLLNCSDQFSYLNNMETKFYRILAGETNGKRKIKISQLWKETKNVLEKIGESEKQCLRETTSETENFHLRVSLLENLECVLKEITCPHSNKTHGELLEDQNKCNIRPENSSQTSRLKTCSDVKLPNLHIMTGHVCRPCVIEIHECPVKCEMLGLVSLEDEMAANLDSVHKICQNMHSCIQESFKEIDITLKVSEFLSYAITDGVLQEIGTFNLAAEMTSNDKQIQFGHIWLWHDVRNDKQLLVFIIDSTILTLEAFHLPHMELIFSKNIDFSKHCFKRGDNEFQYKPFSLYPVSFEHDMSFWENESKPFDEYLFFDVIRGVAKDSIMSVKLIDSYICDITGRKSLCYRLTFQSHDKSLSYNISWKLQSIVRLEVASILDITLR